MMDWMNPCGGMMIMMVIWIALIILAIVALVKWISGSGAKKSHDDEALEILRKRYASGEISKEEFEERKNNLKQ